MTLQQSLLGLFEMDYLTLVLAIEAIWMEETINLVDIILRIIHHTKINKKNNKNSAKSVKPLVIGLQQASCGICTMQKCIDCVNTIHYTN